MITDFIFTQYYSHQLCLCQWQIVCYSLVVNVHSHRLRTRTVDPATQSQFVSLAVVICVFSSSGDCPAAAPPQRLRAQTAQTNAWIQCCKPKLPGKRLQEFKCILFSDRLVQCNFSSNFFPAFLSTLSAGPLFLLYLILS